jgi:heat shock protein HslJ
MPAARVIPACGLLLCGAAVTTSLATAQTIQGTATYKERMALPQNAVFEATLEDVSRADVPAGTVARTRVESPGLPPIAFTISYDPAAIRPANRYVVRATIVSGDALVFTSDAGAPVITAGHPTTVALLLRRAGAATTQPHAGAAPPLEGTHWDAVELAGTAVTVRDASQSPYLLFLPEGRVAGSDGCNRVAGSYELHGERIAFGQLAGTQMACPDTDAIERAFGAALASAKRLTRSGDRLELADANGTTLAVFAARADTSTTGDLAGTSWRLVKFEGGDDTIQKPGGRSQYTIEFGKDGQLTARIDCNRGRGTWQSKEPGQIEFGPLALTRAMCPTGSLHDRMMKHWPYFRSYIIRDGHLFLSLMADGGIYEFEPLTDTGR